MGGGRESVCPSSSRFQLLIDENQRKTNREWTRMDTKARPNKNKPQIYADGVGSG